MSENWSQIEVIAMDNLLSGIKRGWGEIKAVYERIFNGPAQGNQRVNPGGAFV